MRRVHARKVWGSDARLRWKWHRGVRPSVERSSGNPNVNKYLHAFAAGSSHLFLRYTSIVLCERARTHACHYWLALFFPQPSFPRTSVPRSAGNFAWKFTRSQSFSHCFWSCVWRTSEFGQRPGTGGHSWKPGSRFAAVFRALIMRDQTKSSSISGGLIEKTLRKNSDEAETRRHLPGLCRSSAASRLWHIPLRAWQRCSHMQTQHQYVWYVGEPALLCR